MARQQEIDAIRAELSRLRERFDELYLEVGGANAENEMMYIITEERRLTDKLDYLKNAEEINDAE